MAIDPYYSKGPYYSMVALFVIAHIRNIDPRMANAGG